MAFFGGIALGSSVLGVVANTAGATVAMAVAGAVTVASTAAYVGVAAARRRAAVAKGTSDGAAPD